MTSSLPTTAAFLFLLFSVVSSASSSSSKKSLFPDPGCAEPDLKGVNFKGTNKGKMVFDERHFERMSIAGGGVQEAEAEAIAVSLREKGAAVIITRVILKAPVHTCRIKHSPGLREWINSRLTEGGDYEGFVEVQPFSQPPNFNFFDAEGNLVDRVKVADEVTVEDITGFLQSKGVWGKLAQRGEYDEEEDAPSAFDQYYRDAENGEDDLDAGDEDVIRSRNKLLQAKEEARVRNINTRKQQQRPQQPQQPQQPTNPSVYSAEIDAATGIPMIHTTTSADIGVDI